MALDALLKRYFALVVLAMVAAAAYFQASGATDLLGAALGDEQQEGARETGSSAVAVPRREQPTAQPIIDRNPFDSVTGPLKPLPTQELNAGRPELDLSDPLGAPGCDGVQVFIVTESDDPLWSFAALQGPGEPHPTLRRVGDEVSDRKIAFIGYNPREASPAVWLSNDASLCQSLMFSPQPVAEKPAASQPAPAAAAASRSRRGPTPLPADIAAKIQKVSETEYNVDRAVVDKILENQAELMRSARIVPEQKDGKVVGIRLFGIRPNTLLGTLGFQNGDRLETINGFDMSSPEKALEAYARLRTASNLNVKINRRGKPMSVDFRVK